MVDWLEARVIVIGYPPACVARSPDVDSYCALIVAQVTNSSEWLSEVEHSAQRSPGHPSPTRVKTPRRPRPIPHIDPMPGEKHSDTPARWLRRAIAASLVCASLPSALMGCSPAFDWRSVRVPDTQLVTELPCRPSRFQ